MGIIKAFKLGFDYLKYDEDGNVQDTQRAVNDVNLDIEAGQFVAVLGHNGSGKSTLAKHLNALLIPTEGTLWVDGIDTSKEPELWKVRQKAGMVFQNPDNQIIGTVVEEDVGFGPENMGVPTEKIWERVDESLKKTGMTSYRYHSPNKLSGGQKQRVAIAGVMAMRPKCIILDEPTSSLDVSIQAKIINMLIKLKKEQNLTYMFITHDMGVMRNVSNRVAIMYLGKICEIAPTETFYRNPLHPYTQMLLSSIPVVSEEDETIKPKAVECVGEIPSPVNVPTGCSFHTRCAYKCERCTKEDPVMREVEPGHTVRCHLIDK